MSTEETEIQKTGMVDSLLDYAVNVINNADPTAALALVSTLREENPTLSNDELADILIKRKCYSTGAVGAISSSISIIPGVGSVVAMTFGAAADISMTFKQQAELVMEIATLYEHQLSASERRSAILLVTGVGAGSQHLATKGGEQIAKKATEQLAAQTIAKAIPFIGVGVSAGSNILTTYLIGQRAKAYFSPESAELGALSESLDALSAADETTIAGWLTETTQNSYQMVTQTTQDVVGGVIVAGQKSGELVMVGASQTGQGITALVGTLGGAASSAQQYVFDTSKMVGQAVSSAGQSIWDVGKATGNAVTAAGEDVIDLGANAAGSIVDGVGDTTNKVIESMGSASSWLTGDTSQGDDNSEPEITDNASTDGAPTDNESTGDTQIESLNDKSVDDAEDGIIAEAEDTASSVLKSLGSAASLLSWGKKKDEE